MSEQDEAFEQWLTVGHHILCTDTKRAYHNAFGSGWDARGEHDAAELARKDELLKAYRELVKRLDRPEPEPTTLNRGYLRQTPSCEAFHIGLTAPHREIVMEEIARDIANARAEVAELEIG